MPKDSDVHWRDYTKFAQEQRKQSEATEPNPEFKRLWEQSDVEPTRNLHPETQLRMLARNLGLDNTELAVGLLDYSMQYRLKDESAPYGMRYADPQKLVHDLRLMRLWDLPRQAVELYLKYAVADVVAAIWYDRGDVDELFTLSGLASEFDMFKSQLQEPVARLIQQALWQKKHAIRAWENIAAVRQGLSSLESIGNTGEYFRALVTDIENRFEALTENITYLLSNRYEEKLTKQKFRPRPIIVAGTRFHSQTVLDEYFAALLEFSKICEDKHIRPRFGWKYVPQSML